MKLTCIKSELTSALSVISKAIASKPQTPILSGIYMRAENGELELQATNYEIGFIMTIPAEVIEPGNIVLEGRIFQQIVSKLPGTELSISLNRDDRRVEIKSESFRTSLVSMNATDFPTITRLKGEIDFTVNDNILRSLLKKTVFACSTDEQRPIFTGVSMIAEGNRVTMAATNSHRLSVKYENFDAEIGKIRVIVPSRIINDVLANMKSEVPTPVRVQSTFNQISFEFDNLYMMSRLIEGTFPDYRAVIPKELPTTVTLDAAAFRSALDRVSILSRASSYNIVKFEFAGGMLTLSSNNPTTGDAEEQLAASISGPEITIGFNAQYITDVLKNIDGKTCEVRLNQPLGAVMFTDADDDAFTYVVTPVRLGHNA